MEYHPVADLFPMLSDEELADLAADIKAHGLRHRIVMLDGKVLDGRNRLRACEMAGVNPAFVEYDGDDPVGFVVSENIHRRHLTAGQRAVLALELLPFYEEQAQVGRPKASETPADRQEFSRRERESVSRAANEVGASGRAVARAKRVAEYAPDLLPQVKSGELAIDRAERIVRDRQAEQSRIEEARANPTPATLRLDVRFGDFRDVLADLSDVDAIITDPPYPREFLPLLGDLATWADRVLKPDGVLAVLFGQTHLPDVYELLGRGRPYRWTACYLTPGPGYASHARKVQSNWKPVLVYGGDRRFADVFKSDGDAAAKDLHHWGQDYSAFHDLVERLTLPGHTVVDPFLGAGTTLLAAQALGRHGIGCDLDPDAVRTSRRRLGL